MAKFADVNSVSQSTPDLRSGHHIDGLFRLKSVLKLAGWTIPSSSDGLTYNASGDQITHTGTGAGGMGNAHAWFRAQEPGGRREWLFQYGTGGYRVKYSPLAKFLTGSPSNVRVPASSEEWPIFGSGTDASPGYAFLENITAAKRMHIVANSTPIGGAYPFVMFFTSTGAATARSGIIAQEPMAPGSYNPSGEGDPVVLICGTGTGGTLAGHNAGSLSYVGYGTANQAQVAMTGVAGVFNGSLGVDVGSGADINGYPIYTYSVSGSTRIKGVGSTIAIKGPARTYPATANTATDAKVYLGEIAYPYPDNTVPSVS